MGKEYNRSTGYRPRKRKFHGKIKSKILSANMSSASAKKLKLDISTLSVPDLSSSVDKEFQGVRIVDISLIFKELEKVICCKKCYSAVTIQETAVYGLSSKFSVLCNSCEETNTFRSSRMIGAKSNISEINRRSVYAMRCIGQGLAGLRTFCGIMDLPPPVLQKSYDVIVKNIERASTNISKKSMIAASAEEIKLSNNCSDICVSGDGTWKTRGHSSKVGVCTIIGLETGKAIDVEVMSTFCKGCAVRDSNHNCLKNHSGSAGKMEATGMLRIFRRSEEKRKVRYMKYIGDGDTKTFLEISKHKPYGDSCTVEKLECIGHVQKRMGTRLRKIKKEMCGKKLADGKSIGGKGRLTDKLIDQLTVYYGNAIRANTNSYQNMRKAVWATFCHTSSTDEEPMHFFCPTGKDSWCKYEKHIASNEENSYHHKTTVPSAVMDCIKTVYKDLSSPELLKRCVSGKTQNPNESLNSVIWKFCPKTSGAGRTIVDISVNEAVVAFNEGSIGRLNIMKELNVIPGKNASDAALKADRHRIQVAEKRVKLVTLEARRAKRRVEKHKNELMLLKEGETYKAGGF